MLQRVCLRSLGFILSFLCLIAGCWMGCGSTWAQAGSSQPAASSDDKSYRIGPNDVLEIKVFNLPEPSSQVRVDNQGRINLRLIHEVQAACLTENQLLQSLVEKYKKYIKEPQISVFIKEYSGQPVSVIGAVVTPQRFQLQRRARLSELLAGAGGVSEKAGGNVLLLRGGERSMCEVETAKVTPGTEGAPILQSFKLSDVQNGVSEANPYVEPGDIITVPQADQIFVSGSVAKPGQFSLKARTTLIEAINMAGGPTQDAAKKKISLSRQDPVTRERKQIIYSYDDIKNHRAEDVELQANDIIEVPSSTGITTKRSVLASLAQSVGLLPIYTILR